MIVADLLKHLRDDLIGGLEAQVDDSLVMVRRCQGVGGKNIFPTRLDVTGSRLDHLADATDDHITNLPRLVVFHDELDLAAGRLRVKQGGGHGGHNGLSDIDRHIGQNYWRVRIGIGRPENPVMDVKAWVLADFAKSETSGWIAELLRAIADEAPRLTSHDDGGFMSRVAFLAPPPKPIQTETQ